MEPITRDAMDAAIAKQVEERVSAAVRDNDRRHREIADALDHVRAKGAGKIAMDSTIHGAADVYDRALTVLGVDHAGVRDVAALRLAFDLAQRSVAGQRSHGTGFASDAAPVPAHAEFASWFPAADRIERI